LPDRIKFNAPIPPDRQAEIALALVPLADAGFCVTVLVPGDGVELGFRVLLDAPGRIVSFRIGADADAAEWARRARRFLPPN
jgi:hypothetical protein